MATVSKVKRILVIDDEEPVARFLKELLESRRYCVTVESDSTAAVQLIEQCASEFSLVITDQTMPGFTGIDIARHIQKKVPNLPVLLCTGYSELTDENHALAVGVKGFISKPFKCDRLLNTIKELLPEN